MIGLDTLLFTREGFKKLRDLDLYDEVLTPLGVFEPITHMSKIEDIDYYIKVATDEIIPCSRDLELPLYNENHTERILYADCINNKRYFTTKILPYESKLKTRKDLYEIGTKIPKEIPNEWLLLSSSYRYELLCGLMDTPMCSLKGEDGIYGFRPHSYEFEKSLVALSRLFGFAVSCGNEKIHRIVRVGVQNTAVIDDIPIRDRYKDISKMPPNNRFGFMPIKDTGTLKKSVQGRGITVEGGLILVGYSLIPVKCQVL